MELHDLKKKSTSELDSHLEELRREQFNLRMQKGAGQLQQTHQLGRHMRMQALERDLVDRALRQRRKDLLVLAPLLAESGRGIARPPACRATQPDPLGIPARPRSHHP